MPTYVTTQANPVEALVQPVQEPMPCSDTADTNALILSCLPSVEHMARTYAQMLPLVESDEFVQIGMLRVCELAPHLADCAEARAHLSSSASAAMLGELERFLQCPTVSLQAFLRDPSSIAVSIDEESTSDLLTLAGGRNGHMDRGGYGGATLVAQGDDFANAFIGMLANLQRRFPRLRSAEQMCPLCPDWDTRYPISTDFFGEPCQIDGVACCEVCHNMASIQESYQANQETTPLDVLWEQMNAPLKNESAKDLWKRLYSTARESGYQITSVTGGCQFAIVGHVDGNPHIWGANHDGLLCALKWLDLQDETPCESDRMEQQAAGWAEYAASDHAHTSLYGGFDGSWFQEAQA